MYGEKISLNKYLDDLQIQHIPRYAYGEEVAVLVEKTSDKFSLRRSYQSFTVEAGEPAGAVGRRDRGRYRQRTTRVLHFSSGFLGGPTRGQSPCRFSCVDRNRDGIFGASYLFAGQTKQASRESIKVQTGLKATENAELKKQVADLQDPIKGVLADKDKRIAELLQQVEIVSNARDNALIEKQKADDAATT